MLTQRLALTDSLVHACQTKPALHAELVKHNAASELIPRIAELIRRIEDNERKLLAERLLHFEQGSRRYWSFAWVAVLLLMLFSATSFVIIARQAKKLEKAKTDTQKLNEELEDRVNYKVSQLKEQEEVYGRMLDNMMEGVQMIGFDWTYLYLNDVAVRHSKLSREELIGRAIYDVYPAIKDTPLYKVLQDCMNERKQAAIENEFEYPDGQKGYFELLVEPTIEGLMILSMDISERKTRELERTRKGEEVREIVYKISHDIRQPITSILGVSYMLRNEKLTQNELKMVIHEMQESIEQLDERTHGLTEFIQSLRVQDYTSDESAT